MAFTDLLPRDIYGIGTFKFGPVDISGGGTLLTIRLERFEKLAGGKVKNGTAWPDAGQQVGRVMLETRLADKEWQFSTEWPLEGGLVLVHQKRSAVVIEWHADVVTLSLSRIGKGAKAKEELEFRGALALSRALRTKLDYVVT